MNSPIIQPVSLKPVDPDLVEQAVPGHGVPSQDPSPAAQVALDPKEAERGTRKISRFLVNKCSLSRIKASGSSCNGGMVVGVVQKWLFAGESERCINRLSGFWRNQCWPRHKPLISKELEPGHGGKTFFKGVIMPNRVQRAIPYGENARL